MTLKITNSKDNWHAEFNNEACGTTDFFYNDQKLFRVNGVNLGILKEEYGIEDSCKAHEMEKTNWQWVETETVHPFGSEPTIHHKFEQAGKHFRVTTDISIKETMPVDRIDVDNLEIFGSWKKLVVISQKDQESTELYTDEFSLTELKNGEKITFVLPPLSFYLEDENGFKLEIGTGYDLWRWYLSEELKGSSQYVFEIHEDHIFFKRQVLILEEEQNLDKMNLRFNWFFSWSEPSSAKPESKTEPYTLNNYGGKLFPNRNKDIETPIFKLGNKSWPISACSENDYEDKYICFCSRTTSNLLHKWLRTYSEYIDNKTSIELINIKPALCTNTSHVKKHNYDKAIHWDYPYILGFWEWANNLLCENENEIKIKLSDESPFSEFPSAINLKSGSNI